MSENSENPISSTETRRDDITENSNPVSSTVAQDIAQDMENSNQFLTIDEIIQVPLNSSWTFWTDKAIRGQTAADYERSLKAVYTVSTVQDFWQVFNNIPPVTSLITNRSYHLMRETRRPVWEDPENQAGGSWQFKVSKRDSEGFWLELLLAAIGEQFSESVQPGDKICGVSITVRERDDLFQIWNEDASLCENRVKDKVRELVPNADIFVEFYRAHRTHHSYHTEKPSGDNK